MFIRQNSMRSAVLSGLGMLVVCLPMSAFAGTISWVAPGGGSWVNPGNWSSSTVPTALDDVIIAVGAPSEYTVTNASSVDVDPVKSLDMNDANARLLLRYAQLRVDNAFNLRDGELFMQGNIAGRSHVNVGGGLFVSAPALVNTLGSTQFSGNIVNDGTMNVNQVFMDGTNGAGSPGATLVNNGTFSSASGGQFNRIAHTVTNNGTFNINGLDVYGFTNNGTLNVTGDRGTMTLISVGATNHGTINLHADGTTGHSSIGYLSGFETGLVNAATGVINTTGDNTRIHRIGVSFENQGLFNVGVNSEWSGPGGSSVFSNSGVINLVNRSVLNLYGGSFINEIGGVIQGSGTLNSGVANFTDYGLLSPGNSFGRIDITGDYNQDASGILELEIGASGQDELVISSGTATFNGILRLIFVEGYAPTAGAVIDLIAGDVVNNFREVQLINLEDGFDFNLTAGAGNLLQLTALNDAVYVSGNSGPSGPSVPIPGVLWLLLGMLPALMRCQRSLAA